MRHSIFLSYRRADTSGHAGRLCDDLERKFGPESVFRDIESIEAGQNFEQALGQALAEAQVVLVLIGDTWLSETDRTGVKRLENPADYVRNEVATALARHDLVVVPILVEKAVMPSVHELPVLLQPLARLQAIALSEERWRYDLDRVAEAIQQAGVYGKKPPRRTFALSAASLSVVLILACAAIWIWMSNTFRAQDFTGLWVMPEGGYWTVRAEDDQLIVEETHWDSRQVWKRGNGRVTAQGMQVDLQLVYGSRPYRYRHELSLSEDGQRLTGTVTELDSGQQKTLALTRR